MSAERLITMANDIAAFFATAEAGADAPQAMVAHLQRFWPPAMRARLLEHHLRDGRGLTPLAAQAAALLAAEAASS